MSTSSNGAFQREGKAVVVAALVLALLGVMCGPVGGSRSMKSSANLNVLPAPLDQTPPPPEYVQFPPLHHHHIPPCTCSPPPPLLPLSPSPPSPRPPTSRPHLPPPLPSPPPPDEDRTRHSQNGRRLFGSEHVADPNSSNSGRTEFLTSSPGKCTEAPPVGTPLVPYGGYAPVGAPFSYGDQGVPTPAPAPSPTSGADGPSNSQPAPAPQSGDNSTMAHTTMVSAMKFNQCTYTIITNTGNIEGAGTTADVNAEFFNKYGESVLFVDLKSQNRNFNRGATDTFTVVGDCVQNICKMHLSHDDSGPNPSWFVNTVTVSLMYQTHVFNVFEWLAKDEPPYSLSRTISSCTP